MHQSSQLVNSSVLCLTELQGGIRAPHSEYWVERICELIEESVQVSQRPPLRDSVVGQHACLPIQIHGQSTRTPQWDTNNSALKVVISTVAFTRTVQAPGIFIVPYQTVVVLSFVLHVLVGQSNANPFPFPLHLPVTSALQDILAHDLGPVVKPVRVIWIWLFLTALANALVIVREDDALVSTVQIHG